jgi:predicted transcriptional regulator YdeE
MSETIAHTWQDIWEYFEENPVYQRAYTYDFEVYDPSDPETVTVYVAIR